MHYPPNEDNQPPFHPWQHSSNNQSPPPCSRHHTLPYQPGQCEPPPFQERRSTLDERFDHWVKRQPKLARVGIGCAMTMMVMVIFACAVIAVGASVTKPPTPIPTPTALPAQPTIRATATPTSPLVPTATPTASAIQPTSAPLEHTGVNGSPWEYDFNLGNTITSPRLPSEATSGVSQPFGQPHEDILLNAQMENTRIQVEYVELVHAMEACCGRALGHFKCACLLLLTSTMWYSEESGEDVRVP